MSIRVQLMMSNIELGTFRQAVAHKGWSLSDLLRRAVGGRHPLRAPNTFLGRIVLHAF